MTTPNQMAEALRRVLDAHDKEAKAYMTAQVASENFSKRSAKADEAAHFAAMMEASKAEKEARELLAAHDAQPSAELPKAAVEAIPSGWWFNHAQQHDDEEGVWAVGFLDIEDDRFSPIITVDTALYYQPQFAEPLALAILSRLIDPRGTT